MAILTAETKAKIVEEHGHRAGDTGSTEVQVALLTETIKALTEHCKANPKDFHTRRGLLNKVSKRRRLLNYLSRVSRERYLALIKTLGLRH